MKANADYLQLFRNKITVDPNNKDTLITSIYGNLLRKGAKPGVHRLPQDGMLCILPDTKDLAVIPNFFNGKIVSPFRSNKHAIPNPYQKETLTPNSKK
jgi:hypothetical protein